MLPYAPRSVEHVFFSDQHLSAGASSISPPTSKYYFSPLNYDVEQWISAGKIPLNLGVFKPRNIIDGEV